MIWNAANGCASCWLRARAGARSARRCLDGLRRLAAAAILIGLCWSAPSRAADAVKGEASFSTAGGFARLLLKLTEDVASEVTTAGSIIVNPLRASGQRAGRPPARGRARLHLLRAARSRRHGDPPVAGAPGHVNTMSAGERTFVDLMPDGWSGAPPGLPIEVVRELAERARAAERALRQQRSEAQAKKRPPIRVRALVQPTFVRFVFEMPDGVGASSVLNDKKLTLSFNALLTFDMADAKIAAPPNIASINQRVEGDTTLVDITLIGDVDVHPFREDRNYIIDVAFQQAEKPKAPALSAEAPHAAGEKPKAPGTPAAAEKHVKEQMRDRRRIPRRSCRRPRKPSRSR